MARYRIVKNIDEKLPGDDIQKYIDRENPENPEHNKVNYNNHYNGYKGVVWTPLDVPYVNLDLDLMWKRWTTINDKKHVWFDKDKSDINSSRHSTYINHDYRALMLFTNGAYYGDVKGEWYDFVHDEFPDVVKFIDSMPYDNVRWLAFVGRDTHGVGPHYDEYDKAREDLKYQEPSQVRVRWSKVTDWKKEHLYFTKDHAQTRIYPMLPPETNAMAYDGTVHEHGADAGYHPTKRIQLMPMGTLNIPKWHDLLERSIEKYKDYVIYDKHFSI